MFSLKRLLNPRKINSMDTHQLVLIDGMLYKKMPMVYGEPLGCTACVLYKAGCDCEVRYFVDCLRYSHLIPVEIKDNKVIL